MSGHSKFANIKHKKEKNDAAKGKIFTKIGRELAVAVKEGGGPDPNNNSRLRDVIAKAKSNNMPNDTIERNIKKAAGEGAADNYEHITYEGYGPNGTAIIVKTLTDNKNRTASNVRNALDACNILSESCMDSRDSYYEYLYSIGIDVEKEKEEYLDHLHDVYMESESGVFFEAFQISKIFEHLNISERNRALEVIKLMFPQAAEKALTPDLSVLAAQHKKEQELNEEKENET